MILEIGFYKKLFDVHDWSVITSENRKFRLPVFIKKFGFPLQIKL